MTLGLQRLSLTYLSSHFENIIINSRDLYILKRGYLIDVLDHRFLDCLRQFFAREDTTKKVIDDNR
jgi:hypothetical protein